MFLQNVSHIFSHSSNTPKKRGPVVKSSPHLSSTNEKFTMMFCVRFVKHDFHAAIFQGEKSQKAFRFKGTTILCHTYMYKDKKKLGYIPELVV